MTAPIVRIATRASALALWQANHIADRLRQLPAAPVVELVEVVTIGDQNQTDALRQFGGTGVFTREVQRAVLDGRADLAVHSLKDLQTEPTEGLTLAAVPARAPRFDALLLPHPDASDAANAGSLPSISSLDDLPPRARIGTGSPRRQAQLLHLRPDLQLLEIRGNVDTRLKKLDEGQYDAIILAEAGLRRLGLDGRISLLLAPPLLLPAVGQGALGLEARSDDQTIGDLLRQLEDPATRQEITAERTLLHTLRAGCHAPLGVRTEITNEILELNAVILSLDGAERIATTVTGEAVLAERIGRIAAERLLKWGAAKLLQTNGS
ncbi:MAG: hydroxymethylbilane synthase [Planctomycetaceae bacterium]|nr:hydroxymethylbilane synthase [Planctomycetaceae bacterium]